MSAPVLFITDPPPAEMDVKTCNLAYLNDITSGRAAHFLPCINLRAPLEEQALLDLQENL